MALILTYTNDCPNVNEAATALTRIGTNAIPTLLRLLQAHDGKLKLKLFAMTEKQRFMKVRFTRATTLNMEAGNGFLVLGSRAKPALPELIKIYDQSASSTSQRAISSVFYNLGPQAEEAVPSLLRGITCTDNFVRNAAINALRQIRSNSNLVVTALIKSLHDPFSPNRMDAAYTLAAYGTNANVAVNPLLELLKDPAINSNSTIFYANVRSGVEFALQHINPEAAAKASLKPSQPPMAAQTSRPSIQTTN